MLVAAISAITTEATHPRGFTAVPECYLPSVGPHRTHNACETERMASFPSGGTPRPSSSRRKQIAVPNHPLRLFNGPICRDPSRYELRTGTPGLFHEEPLVYSKRDLSRLFRSAGTGLPPFVTPGRVVGLKPEGVRGVRFRSPLFHAFISLRQ
jgi:hypothetical protein